MSVSVYRKHQSTEVTSDFEHAVPYGKAKLGLYILEEDVVLELCSFR